MSEFSSSTFFLRSIPHNHASWQANIWNSTLTQVWFSGLSTFLSINFSQTVRHQAALSSSLYFHRLSTRHCPISCSFYTLYKWLHRHWRNTSHKILWRFCNGRSFQRRFCYFAEIERFSNWCRDLPWMYRKQRKCWLILEKLQLSFQISLLMA